MVNRNMANTIKTTGYFNFVSAIMAFMLWGGWAIYVNANDTDNTGIISGLTQGTASFMITFFLVHSVTLLFHQFKHPVAKLLFPAIVTVCFTSMCLLLIHSLAGTPHILMTIFPAIAVAFSFCLFTSYKLHKISQNAGTHYE
jgi:hypothetical protein